MTSRRLQIVTLFVLTIVLVCLSGQTCTSPFPDGGTNQPPVAQDQSVSVDLNSAKQIVLTATDLDNGPQALAFSVVTQPSHGTLGGIAPTVTYTPAPGYSGEDSFTFKANDGAADSNTATVSITVSSLNCGQALLRITGGTLNGQALTPGSLAGQTVTVRSGEPITGTISVRVWRGRDPGSVFPVIWTPTWGGTPDILFRTLAANVPASGDPDNPQVTEFNDVPISLVAPSATGAEWLVFSMAGEVGSDHVAALSHWEDATTHWNDTYAGGAAVHPDWSTRIDLAMLSDSQYEGLITDGYLRSWWRNKLGQYIEIGNCIGGATNSGDAIRINVGPAAYTWRMYPTPLHVTSPGMVIDGHSLYVFGGIVGGDIDTDVVWKYDLVGGSWTQLPGRLPYAIDAGYVPHAVVAGKLIVGPQLGPTGNGGWGSHSKMIEYSLTGQSVGEETADFGFTIWRPSVQKATNGKVYVFGGWTGDGISSIWRYDPFTQSLALLPATLSAGRTHCATVSDSTGKIWVFGGNMASPPYGIRAMECFDPTTETIVYQDASGLPEDLGAGYNKLAWSRNLGGKTTLFVGDRVSRAVYEFDPDQRVFTRAPLDMPSDTFWGQVADEATGKVYLIESQANQSGGVDSFLWTGTP